MGFSYVRDNRNIAVLYLGVRFGSTSPSNGFVAPIFRIGWNRFPATMRYDANHVAKRTRNTFAV